MIKLRYYQQQAVDAVWRYLRNEEGSPCVVLPTGSGKSWVIAELCRQVVAWGGRAIVLACVKELVAQNAEKIAALVGEDEVGIYCAGLNERATDRPVVVASVRSVCDKAERLGKFQLAIVDEAHLIPPCGSGMYRRFLSAARKLSPELRLVGLTATPYRLGSGYICEDSVLDRNERDDYDRLLTKIVYEANVKDLIADGSLSSVRSKRAKNSPDFSKVKIRNGEFDERDVERVLRGKNALDLICQEIVRETADRKKVVIFCNLVESARAVARLLKKYDPEQESAVVSGSTSADERASIVERFKRAEGEPLLTGERAAPLKYLCNVGVFTTGFDAPNVDCVAIVRPTKSLALYQQMIGRGLRTAPDKKDCLALDYGGNIERFGPIDLCEPDAKGDPIPKEDRFKICPNCGTVVARSYPRCPLCGYGYPSRASRDRRGAYAGLVSSASRGVVLSSADDDVERNFRATYEVDETTLGEWRRRDAEPDAPSTIRVVYKTREGLRFCEWICPEHRGFARKRFESWWRSKSRLAPPTSVWETLRACEFGALAKCEVIEVERKEDSKFNEIRWTKKGKKPELDAAAFERALARREDELCDANKVWEEDRDFRDETALDLSLDDVPF